MSEMDEQRAQNQRRGEPALGHSEAGAINRPSQAEGQTMEGGVGDDPGAQPRPSQAEGDRETVEDSLRDGSDA